VGGDLLEESSIEVGGVVDEYVDAAKAAHGSGHGCRDVLEPGNVQLDDQQIVCLADSLRHGVGVATGGVPGGEGRLCDIHPHAAAGTGDKPHLLFSHVFHVLLLPMRECTCSRYSLGFSRVAWMDDPARFL